MFENIQAFGAPPIPCETVFDTDDSSENDPDFGP